MQDFFLLLTSEKIGRKEVKKKEKVRTGRREEGYCAKILTVLCIYLLLYFFTYLLTYLLACLLGSSQN